MEADSVLAVLYCSKKYLLPHLAKICVKYLESNLTAQNACLLLSQSRLFDETVLVERCFEVIDAQAELALASDGFTQIDSDTVRRILSRETLNAKEVSPFSLSGKQLMRTVSVSGFQSEKTSDPQSLPSLSGSHLRGGSQLGHCRVPAAKAGADGGKSALHPGRHFVLRPHTGDDT